MAQSRGFAARERKARAAWNAYVQAHKLPPDIPARPDKVYKGQGWVSWQDWIGVGTNTRGLHQQVEDRLAAIKR